MNKPKLLLLLEACRVYLKERPDHARGFCSWLDYSQGIWAYGYIGDLSKRRLRRFVTVPRSYVKGEYGQTARRRNFVRGLIRCIKEDLLAKEAA